MYPGFSGGPLVAVDGKIIGLNSSGLMRGVSLTVQTPTIRYVVESLLKHGKMRRGYLGVGIQPARLTCWTGGRTRQKTGALVVSVEPGSPVNKRSFLGDTVVALGSHKSKTWKTCSALEQHANRREHQGQNRARRAVARKFPVTIGERA